MMCTFDNLIERLIGKNVKYCVCSKFDRPRLSLIFARSQRFQRIHRVQNNAQQAQCRRDYIGPRGISVGHGDDCDDDADNVCDLKNKNQFNLNHP